MIMIFGLGKEEALNMEVQTWLHRKGLDFK